MKPNSYEMTLSWSVEDDAYVVEVPEFPGCMAHGQTRQEAIKNSESAIKFWIKTGDRRWTGNSATARTFGFCVNETAGTTEPFFAHFL